VWQRHAETELTFLRSVLQHSLEIVGERVVVADVHSEPLGEEVAVLEELVEQLRRLSASHGGRYALRVQLVISDRA